MITNFVAFSLFKRALFFVTASIRLRPRDL